METKNEFSMIVAIVNRGNTDLVMEAARKAGSTGGTISVARGTGNPEMAQQYGIVVQPEKEIVFIAVKNDIKEAVMQAVHKEAGLATKGSGVIFALPITDEIGLSSSIKEKAEEKAEILKEGTLETKPIEQK